jgi:predicted transcriptional regulator
MAEWRLLSNHGLTLICLARNPVMTLREIGDWVGVTERTAHEITKDLCADGYLTRTQESGRSRYTVHPDMPLRHAEMNEHNVGEMLAMVTENNWTDARNPPERQTEDSPT